RACARETTGPAYIAPSHRKTPASARSPPTAPHQADSRALAVPDDNTHEHSLNIGPLGRKKGAACPLCSATVCDRGSEIKRTLVYCQSSFLHGLGQCGVGMADTGDVLGCTTEFHDGNRFSNELGRHRTHNVDAQHFVGLGVCQNLHETRCITQGTRATVGHEREASRFVGDSGGFELLFVATYPGDFGRGIQHVGNYGVVDVTVLTGDGLGNGHALFLGLVSQHRTAYDVAHCPDVREVGTAVVINNNEPALVQLESNGFNAQTFGMRHPADRYDKVVDHQ